MRYEYLALPAPKNTKSARGQRSAAERLAFAVTEMINDLAMDDWEYVRSDTLTIVDKASRFSKAEERIETILVFRREWDEEATPRKSKIEPTHKEDASLIEKPTRQKLENHENSKEPVITRTENAQTEDKNPLLGGMTRD